MPNTEPIFASTAASSRKRPPLPIWLFVAAIAAAAIFVGASLLAARPQAETVVVRGATVSVVARKTIRDIVSVSGVLELSRKEILTSPGDGTVERVLVDEGDQVAAGQELLRIDTDELEASLSTKKLSLEKLIRQGEQDEAERRFSRRQNEISIAAAERALTDARAEADRVESLYRKKFASESELSAAKGKLSNAEGSAEESKLKQEQAETLYLLSQKNQKVDMEILAAEIADLQATIAACVVRSVRGGTVYSLSAETGGTVKAYAELAVVADPQDVRAALDVPETRIASVSKGMSVTVYVGDSSYPARVETVAPSATSSSSSAGSVVRVTAGFDKKPERPTIGGSVSGEIVAGTIADALVLPRGAFLSSGNYAAAYVVSGGTASKKAASFGIADGSLIQVVSGLAEGEHVIVSDYRDFIHLDTFPFDEGK